MLLQGFFQPGESFFFLTESGVDERDFIGMNRNLPPGLFAIPKIIKKKSRFHQDFFPRLTQHWGQSREETF
jgi:hypothetical protein